MADLLASRLAQRDRALAEGLDVIRWTFDPLDAAAASLSVSRLGAIVENYVAGEDLVMAQWWIRLPHVERRIGSTGKLIVRAQDAADAPVITPGEVLGELSARRVWVAFSVAGDDQPATAAAAVRAYLRDVLTRHFAHGYRIVDFAWHETSGAARYLLAKSG